MSDARFGKEEQDKGYWILSKEYAKMTLTNYRMCYWYRHFTFLRWNHNDEMLKVHICFADTFQLVGMFTIP